MPQDPTEQAIQILQELQARLTRKPWSEMPSLEQDAIRQRLIQLYEGLSPELIPGEQPVMSVVHDPEQEVEEAPEPELKESPEPDPERPAEQAELMEEAEPEPEPEPDQDDPEPEAEPEPEGDDDKTSINQRLAQERTTLADRIQQPRGHGLKSAFDVNARFRVTKALFGGDAEAFDKAIRFLDNLPGPDEARIYMERELAPKFGWPADSEERQAFQSLVLSVLADQEG